MENVFIEDAIKSSTQIEPNVRELLLSKAELEFNDGNEGYSIYYQVRALFKAFEDRIFKITPATNNPNKYNNNFLKQMNEWEREDFKTNTLMQYVFKELSNSNYNNNTNKKCKNEIEENRTEECNFLKQITDPYDGLRAIIDTCNQLPKEWTLIQLCKGPVPETSYNIYPKIHESDAVVYITLLKHALSAEYPTPICIRLDETGRKDIFHKFAAMIDRFKEIIVVDPKDCESNEARAKYWEKIRNFDRHLELSLEDLQNFIFPWNFLFFGIPVYEKEESLTIFKRIKRFCKEQNIAERECVLLSLAAFHIAKIKEQQIYALSSNIASDNLQKQSIINVLVELQKDECKYKYAKQHYPCILVVDERLDHFFWEELNVEQEFCRVNSLQCLWRLYQHHKPNICKGYFLSNITKGACLVDPDKNLPKTEMRMRSFFEYWTPHWDMNFARKPTQDEFFKKFFQNSCYVYAGHGSGLQYINGKHIAKQRMKCVVFLFGCDSSRLHSNGLYSELVGAHLYYHAAMCPTFVGTLMPGLDANMDGVATEILSRWITPHSMEVLPWNEIERVKWLKEGKVLPKQTNADKPNTMSDTLSNRKDYQLPSLCAILARIHQRVSETKYYNTVPYVCRGLPAWNCNVSELPP